MAALYPFTPLSDRDALHGPMADVCRAEGVMSILLVAPEGINDTIAQPAKWAAAVLAHIRALLEYDALV